MTALLLLVATAIAGDTWTHYGEKFTVETVIPAETILTAPADHVGKTLRVEGRITDVCQKAGCWMVIAHEDKSMRVLMKEHGFAVDKGASGGECQVEGKLIAKEKVASETEHFASESKNPDAIPEKQTTSTTTYQLIATAVGIKK